MKVSNAPIQWWYLDKMIEVLGGWPGNTLENEYTVSVTPCFLPKVSFTFVPNAHSPFLPHIMLEVNGWRTVGLIHATKNYRPFRLHLAGIVAVTFFTASQTALMVNFSTTIDSELCDLANARCPQGSFHNRNLSAKFAIYLQNSQSICKICNLSAKFANIFSYKNSHYTVSHQCGYVHYGDKLYNIDHTCRQSHVYKRAHIWQLTNTAYSDPGNLCWWVSGACQFEAIPRLQVHVFTLRRDIHGHLSIPCKSAHVE